MSTRTKILAVVAVLGLLVIVLSRGGGGPSEQRQALEDDPMATYVPAGGTLLDTDSQNEGTSLGKPVQAQITRLLQLQESAVPQALERARAAAADAGWAVGETTERGFLAERRVDSGRLELAVTLIEDALLLPDELEPPALTVNLRHLGA